VNLQPEIAVLAFGNVVIRVGVGGGRKRGFKPL
jgi:hypothetical protein